MRLCSVDGCEGTHRCLGLCGKHYARLRAHGDPLTIKRGENGKGSYRGGYHLVMKNGDRTPTHIRLAEKAIGKKLPSCVVVHHSNGDRTDNRPENLVVCPNQAYHVLLHQRMRAIDACGNPNWFVCVICKKYDDPVNMVGTLRKRKTGIEISWVHQCCEREYKREYHKTYQRKNRRKNGISVRVFKDKGE